MSKFVYKNIFSTEVEVTKEAITYKGEAIPAASIIGIGLSITNLIKIITLDGGIFIGRNSSIMRGMIGEKFNKGTLTNDLSKLPRTGFVNLIITHGESSEKRKITYIPINSTDKNCVEMLKELIKIYGNKFIGLGDHSAVEESLKIPNKSCIVFIYICFLIGIIAFIFSTLKNKGYINY